METINFLFDGFSVAFTVQNITLALIGCFLGTVFGALPGLGPANGVAILIPISFSLGLDAASSMILLTSVYYGAMYGGRISSILINIPGDEPALMTTLDGYPMTLKGQAGEALTLTGIASFFGAIVATIGLMILAPQLVKIALLFGPAEYFALFVMAFATLGGVSSNNKAKTILASALGLAISTIGVDGQTGVPRLSFGNVHFYDGIDFLVVIVGMFAVSEIFIFIENKEIDAKTEKKSVIINKIIPKFKTIIKTFPAMVRGSLLGFFAGILPGAGASLGSFIAYTFEKKVSNKDDTFGKGDERGVAAPEAGNNAAAGGALVPMLSLGVPGSGTTAVLLAMLMTMNITPGPLLFKNNPDVVWGLIAALFFANFILLILNIPMVRMFTRILLLPPKYLMPIVAMISFVGIYGISGSSFDLLLMIFFGLFGWLLRKLNIPLVPVIMGSILGNLMETNLRRAMTISDGNWMYLFESNLAIIIWLITIVGFVLPLIFGKKITEQIEKFKKNKSKI
ncbi:tripartite tricarboxylate transporter permease [Candidatus Pelagibacter bacterium]|nr:tripartite tricarboxylate transporter permease [Candidatus Pelagibacter bacterium]MDA8800715.1 tripartite tricarboxylate transporter permease [Candidatus Pelagibacter bacterium]